eukprot:1159535-Pelagomonas_calceolata.AAC.7
MNMTARSELDSLRASLSNGSPSASQGYCGARDYAGFMHTKKREKESAYAVKNNFLHKFRKWKYKALES